MSHHPIPLKNDDTKTTDNSTLALKKKVMCYNMLNKKKCDYGAKCVYAHSLSEQKIIPLRHKAYTIIKTVTDLSNINLVTDNKLYEMLLQLTKVCALCSKDQCSGGYNCRYGAINAKCKICYDDLVYGNCKKQCCQFIHLTEKGLVPYFKQKSKQYALDKSNDKINDKNNSPTSDDISSGSGSGDSYRVIAAGGNDKAHKKTTYNTNHVTAKYNTANGKIKNRVPSTPSLDNIQGILLTEKFILSHFGKSTNSTSDIDSDSDLNEDVDKMIKYFNDDNDANSDDESIFLV